MRHILAVSDFYVDLLEQARQHSATVEMFVSEPACWWPNGMGGFMKPDAYTVLALSGVRDHWWIEIDLATESLPTLQRKLSAYLDFVARGQLGPGGVVPQVLVTASTPARCAGLRTLALRLPAPAPEFVVVLPQAEAAAALVQSLHE